MSRKLPLVTLLFSVLLFTTTFSSALSYISGSSEPIDLPTLVEGEYVPNEIIVKFKSNVDENTISVLNDDAPKTQNSPIDVLNEKYKVDSIEHFKQLKSNDECTISKPNIVKIKFSEDCDIETVLKEYQSLTDIVEFAEPNYIYKALFVPNDPYYYAQWHLQSANKGGINMEPAWDIATGYGATVAVVDSGVSRGDDLSGTCFVPGYNFVHDSAYAADDYGHGTHCAGTIAQTTNNNFGVAGVAFNACVMPVKVLTSAGTGSSYDIANGVYYAVDHGANIISMSLGGSGSSAIGSAVSYAYYNGVTVVAAAGNDGVMGVVYPAGYDAYVIAVGATTYSKTKASYSNYGYSLDLVAPGGDSGYGVLQETFAYKSTGLQWGFYSKKGTSMACPHVSGLAALLYSVGVTDPDDIRNVMQSTAVDLGTSGWDIYYGYGLIDAYAALDSVCTENQPPDLPIEPEPTDGSLDIDVNPFLSVKVTDPDEDKLDLYFIDSETRKVIGRVYNVSSGERATVQWTGLSGNQTYPWFVKSTDGNFTVDSATWSFKTKKVNAPPYTPSSPQPPHNSVNINVNINLRWFGGDPNNEDSLHYQIYLGTSLNPPLKELIGPFSAQQNQITYSPGVLQADTKYYWKILARDESGLIVEGPIWCFTTTSTEDTPPFKPENVFPKHNEKDVSINTVLEWSGGDPDPGDTVVYDVYFGTSSNPPDIKSNSADNASYPGTLSYDTTYYWKVVAWDNHGLSNSSEIWSFTTISEPNPIPVEIKIENFYKKFIEVEIINKCEESLLDIGWEISIKGGIIGGIDILCSGNIENLVVGTSNIISTEDDPLILGLGKADIVVSLTIDDKTYTENFRCLVLGNIIILP